MIYFGELGLRWTVFAGKFKGEWVAGIGAYLIVDKNRRITFVLTRNISAPENTPPGGLRLTKKQEVTAFSDTYHCGRAFIVDAPANSARQRRRGFARPVGMAARGSSGQ